MFIVASTGSFISPHCLGMWTLIMSHISSSYKHDLSCIRAILHFIFKLKQARVHVFHCKDILLLLFLHVMCGLVCNKHWRKIRSAKHEAEKICCTIKLPQCNANSWCNVCLAISLIHINMCCK